MLKLLYLWCMALPMFELDVEDGVDELLDGDVHDVDLDEFPHLLVHYQSGMYLTLIATHQAWAVKTKTMKSM